MMLLQSVIDDLLSKKSLTKSIMIIRYPEIMKVSGNVIFSRIGF